jgi:hypothetical protein
MKTTSVVSFLLLVLCYVSSARGQTLEWTRQLGTSSDDASRGVSADGLGNVYISGITEGSLDGTNAGGWDAFISRYDASGTLEWTRQLGNIALRIDDRPPQSRRRRARRPEPMPKLTWDGQNMKVTNLPEANDYLHREYRKGWTL